MAAPVIANHSLVTTSTPDGAGVIVPVPSGVVNGDLLIATVGCAGSAVTTFTTVPSGWNEIQIGSVDGGAAMTCGAWWRVASSEPASHTWIVDNASDAVGAMIRITGQKATGALHQFSAETTATAATSLASTGVTTTLAECLIFSYCAVGDTIAMAFTPDSGAGWTELYDHAHSDTRDAGETIMYKTLTSAGSSGNATHTVTGPSSSDSLVAFQFAVAPEPAAFVRSGIVNVGQAVQRAAVR